MTTATWTASEFKRRDRIFRCIYPRIVTMAHRLKRRWRARADDFDLTVDDLGQLGAERAFRRYDRIYLLTPVAFLSLSDQDLAVRCLERAGRAMTCHIIDTYRSRDRRRAAIAPDGFIEAFDTQLERSIAARARGEEIYGQLTGRRRQVFKEMWRHGECDVREVAANLGLSVKNVHKIVGNIRRTAGGCSRIDSY